MTLLPRIARKWRIHPGAVLAVSGVIFLGGCVVEDHPRREVIVEPAPMTGDEIVVNAPPPPRDEVIVARPSPGHVWIRGYWAWRGGHHVWVGGRWELPPHPGYVWTEPRWEARGNGFVFIGGSWRVGDVAVHATVAPVLGAHLAYVAQPPPPVRREVIVEQTRPSRDHIWIGGYWVWREGRHFWVGGHWERPPHAHAVWVAPRWEHHPEGYVFIQGYWH
jgi:hypothetical protein